MGMVFQKQNCRNSMKQLTRCVWFILSFLEGIRRPRAGARGSSSWECEALHGPKRPSFWGRNRYQLTSVALHLLTSGFKQKKRSCEFPSDETSKMFNLHPIVINIITWIMIDNSTASSPSPKHTWCAWCACFRHLIGCLSWRLCALCDSGLQ